MRDITFSPLTYSHYGVYRFQGGVFQPSLRSAFVRSRAIEEWRAFPWSPSSMNEMEEMTYRTLRHPFKCQKL